VPSTAAGSSTPQCALTTLQRRIELFLSLPHSKLDRLALKRRLDEIGRSGEAEHAA
jgi:arsenate reductase